MCTCCHTFVGSIPEARHLITTYFGEDKAYLDPIHMGNIIHLPSDA